MMRCGPRVNWTRGRTMALLLDPHAMQREIAERKISIRVHDPLALGDKPVNVTEICHCNLLVERTL